MRRLLQVLKCSKADPGEEPMDTDDRKSSDLWSFPVRLLLIHLQYPQSLNLALAEFGAAF